MAFPSPADGATTSSHCDGCFAAKVTKLTLTTPPEGETFNLWLRSLQLILADRWHFMHPTAMDLTMTPAAARSASQDALRLIWFTVDPDLQKHLLECVSGAQALDQVRAVLAAEEERRAARMRARAVPIQQHQLSM